METNTTNSSNLRVRERPVIKGKQLNVNGWDKNKSSLDRNSISSMHRIQMICLLNPSIKIMWKYVVKSSLSSLDLESTLHQLQHGVSKKSVHDGTDHNCAEVQRGVNIAQVKYFEHLFACADCAWSICKPLIIPTRKCLASKRIRHHVPNGVTERIQLVQMLQKARHVQTHETWITLSNSLGGDQMRLTCHIHSDRH